MPLRVSSVNMVQQDNEKLTSKRMSLHSDLHKHRTCNLGNEEGSLIVKKAFGQLQMQIKEGHNYASVRRGQAIWNVIRSTDRKVSSILPVFERKRTVTWNENKSLSCSCGYTKRWGIPCRHIAHVVELYSNNKKCCFTHHDVDLRWWNIHALMVFDANALEPKDQDIRQSLERIGELQQQQYPIVNNLSCFSGVDYKYGENSSHRFKSMNVEDAMAVFSFTNSRILNYLDTNANISCIGITKTVYLGEDSCDNTLLADVEDTSRSESIEVHSSITSQQDLISSELEARKKCTPMSPHEVFGPLYKEISDSCKGDTLDELNITKSILQSIINDAKARRAAKTKTITGRMVTSTAGNSSKEHTRFKHKKQRLW
jgi:hypothetical protein